MPRIPPSIEPTATADHTGAVAMVAALIAALYFGSEILIPIALAILLSFAMAPAVKLLHKLGLGRVLPVIITVLVTFMLLAALAVLMATQLRDLSTGLPRYEATIVRKIDAVKSLTNSGALRKIDDTIAKFTRAIGRSGQPQGETTSGAQADAPGPNAAAGQPAAQPMPVEVVQPPMGPIGTIVLVAAPLLHPLATAAVVLIFVIFILLQREDLRNRTIRLFGASDLQRATAAIDDGGKRLSRYLLAQCAINATAGLVVGTALWLVGIPSPILLGITFAFARFVPYIGPVIGAALPLLLAMAVDPGWSMVVWTAAALAAVEVIIGQVIEPFAYGHNTGLSPIAIVVSATFWTVLWGPIGLLLSTPLTVCLVVLGRHVEKLAFLDVLLGDQPPLSPAETFYQRLLANDPVEVADQAQKCLGDMSVSRYYDEVAIPGLLMAQDDATAGRLDQERQALIKASAMEVVDDLDHEVAERAGGSSKVKARFFHFGRKGGEAKDLSVDDLMPEQGPERLQAPGSVLCIGARGPLDDAAAAMLAQVFAAHGIGAVADSFTRLSRTELPGLDLSHVQLICVSALDGSSPAFLRFILRRLRRHAPAVDIALGAWWRRDGYRKTDAEIDEVVREPKVATLLDAVRYCFTEAGGESRATQGDGEQDEPLPLAAAS